MWQRYNFAAKAVTKIQVKIINVDETSVAYYYDQGKGYIVAKNKHTHVNSAVMHASRGNVRGAMTHVALICDDSELQAELPQVFIFHNN